MTSKVIHRLQGFSNAIVRPFVWHLRILDLKLHSASRGTSAIAGLLDEIQDTALFVEILRLYPSSPAFGVLVRISPKIFGIKLESLAYRVVLFARSYL